jgi:hypothetical protein
MIHLSLENWTVPDYQTAPQFYKAYAPAEIFEFIITKFFRISERIVGKGFCQRDY